jgi:hypothetical protein
VGYARQLYKQIKEQNMNRSKQSLLLTIIFVFSLLAFSGDLNAGSMSSSSYNLNRMTFGESGASSASVNYDVSYTVGQPSPVGHMASNSYGNDAGFWQLDQNPNLDAGVAVDMDYTTHNYEQTGVTLVDIETQSTAAVGEDVWIAVVAQNVTNLDTYQVEINFDSSKIMFLEGYEENPFAGVTNLLKKNGGTTIGFQAVESVSGTVNIANALVGTDTNQAPEGSGVLALLKFRVLGGSCDTSLILNNVNYVNSVGVNTLITTTTDGMVNPCGSGCPGDTNIDGDVDGSDLAVLAAGGASVSLNDFAGNFGKGICP